MNITINEANVIRTISINDEMFAGDKTHEEWYWTVGRSATEVIASCLSAAHKSPNDIRRILDLPCGHGRVLRYLKASFPEAKLTACDLLRDGVDFCSSTFGATPVYSHEDLTRLLLDRDAFDLIWVGSLFTHISAGRWKGFLDVLTSSLAPNGLLIFSAHGHHVYNRMRGVHDPVGYGLPFWRNSIVTHEYERKGFGYADYQRVKGYGVSLSDPAWVCAQIRQSPRLKLACFLERGWHDVHDVYACVRIAEKRLEREQSPIVKYAAHRSLDVLPQSVIRLAKTLRGKRRA